MRRHIILALALATIVAFPAAAQDEGVETETRHFDLKFPRGRSGTSVDGTISREFRDEYLFKARAGQTVAVRLVSDDSEAFFDIYGEVGFEAVAVTPEGEPQREWTGRLPKANGYAIHVMTNGSGGPYTLEVTIK